MKKPFKLPFAYITYERKEVDKGDYLIVGDQYYFPKHIVVKKLVKNFESRDEKIAWRIEQFRNLKTDAWYKRWFKGGVKKGGLLSKDYIEFIEDFIERTVDYNHNEFARCARRILHDRETAYLGKGLPYVNEILICVMVKIRHHEEGIINIPFRTREKDFPELILKKTS
jgi:hypothetical protein